MDNTFLCKSMNLYFIQIIEHNIEGDGYIEREREFDEERTIYLKSMKQLKTRTKIHCVTIGM